MIGISFDTALTLKPQEMWKFAKNNNLSWLQVDELSEYCNDEKYKKLLQQLTKRLYHLQED